MNRDKQIEEIILIVKGAVADNAAIDFEKDRILLDGNDLDHLAEQIAEHTTVKGYRKASEVAREIFEDCHNTLIKILDTVRDGLDKAIREGNEDAKLVHIGTEETVKCIILIFAELKKKYTEGGNGSSN